MKTSYSEKLEKVLRDQEDDPAVNGRSDGSCLLSERDAFEAGFRLGLKAAQAKCPVFYATCGALGPDGEEERAWYFMASTEDEAVAHAK
jgi:hypothetical protein